MSREDITIYEGDYIHESVRIGHGTRIGGGHDIGKDVVIGEDCNIQYGVFISNEWRMRAHRQATDRQAREKLVRARS